MVFFAPDEALDTPVYQRAELSPGHALAGPGGDRAARCDDAAVPGRSRQRRRCPQPDDRACVMTSDLDPITLEILANALRSVTDESFAALMRSAYSTNIKERHDHSTTIMDARGQADRAGAAVAADPSRLDVGADGGAAGEISDPGDPRGRPLRRQRPVRRRRHAPAGRQPGDAGVRRGRLVAFVCNIAHHADIGGMAPGSMAGGMSEIFQEGLRIPVLKLFRRGELQQDLLDLLLLNVRVPEERRGDYFAQIAASRLGVRRLEEVIAEPWAGRGRGAASPRCARAPRRVCGRRSGRSPTAATASPDVMDGDGIDAHDIPIVVEVSVEGERIRFDFAGTAPQVPGSINVTLNATDRRGRLRAQGAGRPRRAEQPGHAGRARGRGRARHAGQCGVSGAGLLARPYQPADHRRGARRARPGAAGARGRGRQRRQLDGGVRRHRSAHRAAVRLSRDARRRHGRAADEGRQGRRAGRHHQHLEPAGRGDRARVPSAGRGVQPDPGFRRRRAPIAAGSACAAWCGRSARAACSTASASVSATSPGGCSAAGPAGPGSS